MLKSVKYNNLVIPVRAWMGMIMVCFFCLLATPSWGQEKEGSGYFTLTNGNLWWLDGDNPAPENDEANRYVRGWTKINGSYYETRTLGSHAGSNTTLITKQGEIYLALNIIDGANGVAELVTRSTEESPVDGDHHYTSDASGFNLYCAWYRTGNNGFYYQEWDGWRYYLIQDPSTKQLRVYSVRVGSNLDITTYWYNWDYGVALEIVEPIDGSSSTTNPWMVLDTIGHRTDPVNGSWKLSRNSYNRPDEKSYTVYDESNPQNENISYGGGTETPNVWFYENRVYQEGDVKIQNAPVGMPAIYMPVTITMYERSIGEIATGEGIQGMKKKVEESWNDADNVSGESLAYTTGPSSIIMKPTIVYHGGGNTVQMIVRPEYKLYEEEVYRRGIHLNYQQRENLGFNEGGVIMEMDNIYYWPETYGGEWIKHDAPPAEQNDNPEVDSVTYSLDVHSRRYMTIDNSRNSEANGYEVTLTLSAPPPAKKTVVATLTVTVHYHNATTQSFDQKLNLTFEKPTITARPNKGPVVRGYVCGGGRMANVGLLDHNDNGTPADYADDIVTIVGGNTHITVHSADSLYAIYGGNDIAGWVQGEKGAIIQLGTEKTSEDHPIHIGYIYGGGCGYYSYGGVYDASTTTWKESNVLSVGGLSYGEYAFRGDVYRWHTATPTVDSLVATGFNYAPYTGSGEFALEENGIGFVGDAPSGTIPYIRTAHITVGVSDASDDYHYLHNDYIIIDSLFGGAENSFIGVTALGPDLLNGVTININGGTLQTVFGGNNYGGSVANTSTVHVTVYNTKLTESDDFVTNSYYHGFGRDFGIRYLFGGGNLVESSNAFVTISGGMIDTVFGGGNRATVKSPVTIVDCQRNGIIDRFGNNGHYILSNPTLYTNPEAPDTTVARVRANDVPYEPDMGRYNVRCLFGGNNMAPMDNLSIVGMHSGGVGAIYGGGNMGDMTCEDPVDLSGDQYYPLVGFNKLFDDAFKGANFSKPNKVSAIVASTPQSKIFVDYVYGGCRKANVRTTCGVYHSGGIAGYIFGGNDVSGDVGSEMDGGTYAIIDGGTVLHNVYGGSDGYYHCNDGSGHYDDTRLEDMFAPDFDYDPYGDMVGMLIPTHNNTHVYMKRGYVKGNIYSGGVKASVGFDDGVRPKIKKNDRPEEYIDLTAIRTSVGTGDGTRCGTIHLTVSGGTVEGDVYGGSYQASVFGLAYLWIKNHTLTDEWGYEEGTTFPTIKGRFFGGNDCVGSIMKPFRPYKFDWNGTDPAGAFTPASPRENAAVITSDNVALNNYIDGKYEAAFSTYLNIEGTPRIGSVYGSGNGAYNYDGTRPYYPSVQLCKTDMGFIPNQTSAYIDIHTGGGFIDTVFGGGNGATVSSAVVVLLNTTIAENPEDPTGDGKNLFVGTIFGGNNFDQMAVVPDIIMKKGCVKNVYGGSNAGIMKGSEDRPDICGNLVTGVTTYVLVDNDEVTITDSLFGGCRMSDVAGMSFVDVRRTSTDGIQYLYGGNDISGDVQGNTRVDVSGGTVHHIWGGSNGRYDFIPVGHNEYLIYPYNSTNTGNPADSAGRQITIAAMPDVDSSNVNIWGGTISTSVYGGGSMADSRATCVVVNDNIDCVKSYYGGSFTGASISGSVFAGGEGYWVDLNAPRRGNVTEATHLHLHHASEITDARAYGGGKGGNVHDTYVMTYEEWNNPFNELYGGCWGSNVTGTAHLDFHGVNLVHQLFGGNDFTGDVYKSVINVYSGRFKNVFGGGNGVYPDSYYTTNHADAIANGGSATAYTDEGIGDGMTTYHISKPNTEFIELNFYGGTVDSCVYGGGKMGTVWNYQRNADRTYRLVSRKPSDLANFPPVLKVPDTSLTLANAHKDPGNYSYIILNMHGGNIAKNVFGGGCGSSEIGARPIVYGLKQVNMDGGYVGESVYGGSEFVNDGYLAECNDGSNATDWEHKTDHTTLRPSSIVNLTGGTIEGFLYGAGFLGDVYGSTYVNVGIMAIDSCKAYLHTIKDSVEAYSRFKPGVDGGLVAALEMNNDLLINHSIYTGANWGTNTGSTVFTKRGYHGGESRIIVDGLNYNTANDGLSGDPAMNIRKSIIGAGTSANGGDVVSNVSVRNYGAIKNCLPSKQLESIQRVDSVLLHNTAIEFVGSTDATSAYISEQYSLKNVDIMDYRGYNVSQFDAVVSDVYTINIYKQGYVAGHPVLVPVADINQTVITEGCEDICEKLKVVAPLVADLQHTLILMNNGVDMTLRGKTTFGIINGYAYITSMPGFLSTIVAANSTPTSPFNGYLWNEGMSGFVSPCAVDNQNIATTHGDGGGPTWNGEGSLSTMEYPFKNYAGDYRVWRVGEGIQQREVAILAHTVPDSLATPTYSSDINTYMHFQENDWRLALSEATVVLPATEPGHYYRLDGMRGFTLSGENAPLTLVDSAWLTNTNGVPVVRVYDQQGHLQDRDGYGEWAEASLMVSAIKTGVVDVKMRPNNTFGLVMIPTTNFQTGNEGMPAGITYDQSTLVVSGNSYVNSASNYYSPKVAGDVGSTQILPEMKFYLTYDPDFTSAFLGTVTFVLQEYDGDNHHVGDVEVKAYISTIVGAFKDMEDNVLAMYNNGRTNEFNRKVILPAVMEERNLYITDVAWVPTSTGTKTEADPSTLTDVTDRFYLVPSVTDATASTGATTGDYPHDRILKSEGLYYAKSHNRFSLNIIPGENVSSDLNASIGWNNIAATDINVYDLVPTADHHTHAANAACRIESEWHDDVNDENDSVVRLDLRGRNGNAAEGFFIGTLNGRGSTVLNFRLGFDGTRVYDNLPNDGYVGKVILGMETYHNGLSRGKFTVTIYVKTRENGDTIYLASNPDYVERGGVRVYPYHKSYKYMHASAEDQKKLLGKSPNCYVNSFQQALSTGLYQEGDVIAIMDAVVVDEDRHVAIQGANGPAVEVIRYDGHHHEFPGDSCVYRGPMVVVDGPNATFSAKNIAFHGGAGAFVKPMKRDGSGNPVFDGGVWADNAQTYHVPQTARATYHPDTNAVFGPIIQVKNNANATLADGTTLMHNWNEYDGVDASLRGTISLTAGGMLHLQNDITLANNICHNAENPYDAIHPLNGVLYIDGGQLILEESNPLSKITIEDNYLLGTGQWWEEVDDTQNPSGKRWKLRDDAFDDWQKANVFLTRTAPAAGTEEQITMHDVQSDHIVLNGTQSPDSRIGVRKWFPGPTMRDTISIATFSGGDNQTIATAVANNVFSSDDGIDVFYSTKVNSSFAYLFRCASFKHQWYTTSPAHTTIDPLAVVDADLNGTPDFDTEKIKSSNTLYYSPLESNCPTGGDSIIYRVQGGFAPYVYTWTDFGPNGTYGELVDNDDKVLSVKETPYANNVIQNHLYNNSESETNRLSRYLASVADTFYTSLEKMDHDQASVTRKIRVSAVDATGVCKLYKDIDIIVDRHWLSSPEALLYAPSSASAAQLNDRTDAVWQTEPTDGWTDTNRLHVAHVSRNFKAITLTPMAWVDRSQGTISAVVDPGSDNDHVYEYIDAAHSHELSNLYFCEGDVVVLKARESASSHFVMWDFDPYYRNPAVYVMPSSAAQVIAYFGPDEYWKDHINTTSLAHAVYDPNYTYTSRSSAGDANAGFVTTYNGDVHIYNEEGLAWLISCVNGLNGTQARTYRFNRVLIHPNTRGGSDGVYDMQDYLWTPMGTEQHPFMGHIYGVGSDETDETPWSSVSGSDTTWESKVIIKNIIVNEPNMYNAGFFGTMDSAHVVNIGFHGALVRGSQYVGTLAGKSSQGRIYGVEVASNIEDDEFTGSQVPTTILSTHYVSGGLLGHSVKDTVLESGIAAKFVGDAVYSGGGIGWGDKSIVRNVNGVLWSRMQGNYLGGVAGYLTGQAPVSSGLFRSKSPAIPSQVQNNYFRIVVEGEQQRIGGVAGYAEQALVENNYIFGDLRGTQVAGVAGLVGDGMNAEHNYYEEGAAHIDVALTDGDALVQSNSSFKGTGNHVLLNQPAYGVNNLTRVLNIWVRQHNAQGGHFRTWRSDLVGDNFGYPVFGQPDLIPVNGEATVEGCDEVVVDGITYTSDSIVTLRFIDYDEMIDSIQTTYIVVHHTSTTALSDSATAGVDYEGYGFSVTATESALLQSTIDSAGYATLVISDTLSNMYGCDSIITLTLTFTAGTPVVEVEQGTKVNVYPNPTTSWITVEADQMSHVEVYDNEGRRLQNYDANGRQSLRIDLSYYASGIYYIRIHSPYGVTIQKVIKR